MPSPRGSYPDPEQGPSTPGVTVIILQFAFRRPLRWVCWFALRERRWRMFVCWWRLSKPKASTRSGHPLSVLTVS